MTARSASARVFLTVWLVAVFFADPHMELAVNRVLLLSRSLAEHQVVWLDHLLKAETQTDIVVRDGRHYAGALPGPALFGMTVHPLAVAIHAAAGRAWRLADPDFHVTLGLTMTLLLFAPCLALTAVLLLHLTLRLGFDIERSVALTLGLALGSPLLFYTMRPGEYPPLILLEAVWIFLVLKYRLSAWPAPVAVLGGFLLAASLFFNPFGTLLMSAFGLFFLRPRPISVCAGALGALPPLLVLSLYNRAAFGGYFSSAYSDAANAGTIGGVYASYAGRIPALFAQLTSEVPVAAWHLLVGMRGLWIFFPLGLLASIGLFRANGASSADRRLGLALLAAVLLNFSMNLAFIHGIWAGGVSWGPRYLLPMLPFLVLAVPVGWPALRLKTLWIWSGVSIGVTWLGVQFGHSHTPLTNLAYFFLSGPTTPFHRWFVQIAETRLLPDLLERSAIGFFGQYHAYRSVSATGAYLALGALLWLIWRRPAR